MKANAERTQGDLKLGDLKSKELYKFYGLVLQIMKFSLVGVSNTFISLSVYYILVILGIHYILANMIAFIISVFNAFYWNRKFVFKENEVRWYVQLAKVYASYGTTFVLGTTFLFIMVNFFGISEFIAPLINLCITTPLNFCLNKFWAFRKKRKAEFSNEQY